MLNLLSPSSVILEVASLRLNLLINLCIQILCLALYSSVIYSASVINVDTVCCFFNIHAMTSPFSIKTYLIVDLQFTMSSV